MSEDAAPSESLNENHDPPNEPNTKGEGRNIFVLLVLYTLQGVPLGLSSVIPIILQANHKTSFNDQAIFSFAFWPFSMKLLWAPLVDSLYVRKLGRRKSWLIPVQYTLGISLFVVGFFINEWLINADKPNLNALTVMFFLLNFLAATQDVVVDGWALTMLKRKNISYASMCNSAGQAFGIFLGYGFLMILLSETFWNNLRSSPQPDGVVSLQGYFYFWGVMYMAVTTLVAIFKTENDYVTDTGAAVQLSIVKTYELLFKIVKLPSIKMLVLILVTVDISFASVAAAFRLKLIDSGITNDQVATIESLYIPLELCLPFLIAKFTSKKKPLKLFYNTIPYRLSIGIVSTLAIFFTPTFLAKTGPSLIAYKICLVLICFLKQIMESIMMQLEIAFFSKVSDPKIGGTNMTLLNTVGNIGFMWSYTTALWLIDVLTFKNCSTDYSNACFSENDQNLCKSSGGICLVKIDGYYVVTVMCTIYGVLWYCIFRKPVNNLQSKNANEWYVETKIG